MNGGLYKKMRGNNEIAEGKLKRIHLLVSVHPDNETASSSGSSNRDYDILVVNPKDRDFVGLIRQIVLIRIREESDDREGVCENTGDKIEVCSSPGNRSRNGTKNRCNI